MDVQDVVIQEALKRIRVSDPGLFKAAMAEGKSLSKAAGVNPGPAQLRLRETVAGMSGDVRRDLFKAAAAKLTGGDPILTEVFNAATREVAEGAVKAAAAEAAKAVAAEVVPLSTRLRAVEEMAARPGGAPRASGANRPPTLRELHLAEMRDVQKAIEATSKPEDRVPLLAKMRELELVLRGIEMGGR